MDTFMDKLAQKLTAQEMIKANAAADAEELSRLQNQVKEYNECLVQMRQVNQEMQAQAEKRNREIQARADKLNQEIQAGAEKIGKDIQARTEKMSQDIQAQTDKMSQERQESSRLMNQFVEETLNPQVDKLVADAVNRLENASVDGARLNKLIEDGIAKIQEVQQDQDGIEKFQKILGELLEQTNEFVHKENVKVYRNVQAVIVEEGQKNSEAMKGETKGLTSKMNLVFGISIGALAASLGGLILQLLQFFKVI